MNRILHAYYSYSKLVIFTHPYSECKWNPPVNSGDLSSVTVVVLRMLKLLLLLTCQEPPSGVEDGLRSTGVPFLASVAREHIGVRLAFNQEQHLGEPNWK